MAQKRKTKKCISNSQGSILKFQWLISSGHARKKSIITNNIQRYSYKYPSAPHSRPAAHTRHARRLPRRQAGRPGARQRILRRLSGRRVVVARGREDCGALGS